MGVMSVGYMMAVPAETGEDTGSPGVGASWGCETPNVSAGNQMGLLEEQQELLMAEPSLCLKTKCLPACLPLYYKWDDKCWWKSF